jgi:catalase-peroxidase
MGFPTYGFGGGRHDAWEADNSTYWGPEVWNPKDVSSFDSMVTRDKRWRGKNGDADYDLENPLGRPCDTWGRPSARCPSSSS